MQWRIWLKRWCYTFCTILQHLQFHANQRKRLKKSSSHLHSSYSVKARTLFCSSRFGSTYSCNKTSLLAKWNCEQCNLSYCIFFLCTIWKFCCVFLCFSFTWTKSSDWLYSNKTASTWIMENSTPWHSKTFIEINYAYNFNTVLATLHWMYDLNKTEFRKLIPMHWLKVNASKNKSKQSQQMSNTHSLLRMHIGKLAGAKVSATENLFTYEMKYIWSNCNSKWKNKFFTSRWIQK